MARTNRAELRFKSFGGRIAVVEGREPEPLLDGETAARIDSAGDAHPDKKYKIRARKRYVTASAEGKAGIEEAIHQSRLRRLKALWDPE